MVCYLCRKNERISYLSYYCYNCKKIQDLLSVYSDRVYEVLESVLCRSEDKQNNKIKAEIKSEINYKQDTLMSELKDKIKDKKK